MKTIPEQIVYIGQLMFERHLTDIAGGNISVRDDDKIYCTPRYAGHKMHWHLSPMDIVVGSLESDELLENPLFSREGLSHLYIYRAFPEAKAIIHAHPPNILPFCVIEKPIEPVLLAVKKFGVIGFIETAPSYSQEQAEKIVASLLDKRELIQSSAAAILIPQHGIFVVSQDLWMAIDALERINTNAWCILTQRLIA